MVQGVRDMKKTDNIKLLSYAVQDLRKIINFFDEINEEITGLEIKTPTAKIYVDIDEGCLIDTAICNKDSQTNKIYELVNPLYGIVTMDNFRLLSERTIWNYEDEKQNNEEA